MLLLPTLAQVAQARPIDWQAELDRCRALREQTEPLLRAGIGVSAVALGLRRAVAFGSNSVRYGMVRARLKTCRHLQVA
jgi:hypothetical protein